MRDRKDNNRVRRQQQLEQHAWCNRRAMTESEARLWGELSGRKLGVQFRRQVPIDGRYIVDFAAPAARLVVEVDGGYHVGRRGGDRRRDERLRELGWRVVRVEATLVMRELGAAVGVVRAAL